MGRHHECRLLDIAEYNRRRLGKGVGQIWAKASHSRRPLCYHVLFCHVGNVDKFDHGDYRAGYHGRNKRQW